MFGRRCQHQTYPILSDIPEQLWSMSGNTSNVSYIIGHSRTPAYVETKTRYSSKKGSLLILSQRNKKFGSPLHRSLVYRALFSRARNPGWTSIPVAYALVVGVLRCRELSADKGKRQGGERSRQQEREESRKYKTRTARNHL